MIGIGQHSYTEAWKPDSGAKFGNAFSFLEYAHSIGAAGVQVVMRPDDQAAAGKIRARAEELGVWFEGNMSLPKTDADAAAFDAHAGALKAAGATVARTACLGGRRYETFKTLAEFRAFKETSWNALRRVEPILKKHKLKLAVENHKDWLAPEHVEILRKLSSEWIGALIDTGNSIALLENSYEIIEALAPFALSSHLKDMAVQEYPEGFLLSEVPLGKGFLDIPRIVGMLRKANPHIRLNLEMITRDPLKIPCLTDAYYATFESVEGSRLAKMLAVVKSNRSADLPRTAGLTSPQRAAFEDDNVQASIQWASKHLVT